MIERVARAICDSANREHGCGGFCQAVVNYGDAARAAIEAMLQPTDAMIDMMYDADNDGEVEHAYRSAIRAALNEQVAG
jgi:hypothetical protein